jgi:signal transduction histidine kinase
MEAKEVKMLANPLSQPNLQRDERLQALYHLAVELSALRSLESVLNTALQHCLDLTGSQFGFIGLNPTEGLALDVVAIQGFHPSASFYEHNHLIPLRPNIFARAVLENRPVRSVDAATDPQRVGQPHGHPRVGTFLGVPLRIRDEPIGMIGVANRLSPYDDDHEQLLMTYAAQVAIVIRNAQLYEQLTTANEELERKVTDRTQELEEAKEALAQKASQLQQLLTETVNVQEREQQRIAQDMHDGTNQLLIGAMLELKSARERLTSGNLRRADESLQTVKDILRRVEAEIKRIVYDLRPPTLDALGLAPALRRYAERFEQYAGLPCSVQVLGEPARLPSKMEISIYRLMQEALQNVSAHAQAKQAEVIVTFAPKTLKLVIMDDGRGFDLATVQSRHNGSFGLLSMAERAESLGGRLSIQTQLGMGTQVELVVPVQVNHS